MSHHLNKEDRKAIDHYLKRKWKQTEIAKVLKRNKDVISKEINRNKDKNGIYHYGLAFRELNDTRLPMIVVLSLAVKIPCLKGKLKLKCIVLMRTVLGSVVLMRTGTA